SSEYDFVGRAALARVRFPVHSTPSQRSGTSATPAGTGMMTLDRIGPARCHTAPVGGPSAATPLLPRFTGGPAAERPPLKRSPGVSALRAMPMIRGATGEKAAEGGKRNPRHRSMVKTPPI